MAAAADSETRISRPIAPPPRVVPFVADRREAAARAARELWCAPYGDARGDEGTRARALRLARVCAGPERHLTWFLAHHYACDRTAPCTHTTRISSGTALGHTTAARLRVPASDARLVRALVYACNAVGAYADRAYVVERFEGPEFGAHLEVDHLPDQPTVLREPQMRTFLQHAAIAYGCAARATRSSRGGNRVHVFFERRTTQTASHALRAQCRTLFDVACGGIDTTPFFALDASTTETRSIRAPFARSCKPYRADWYEPWLLATPDGRVRRAEEAGLTLGAWIEACSPVLVA